MMGALSAKLRNVEDGGLTFWCPGCDMAHRVWVGTGNGPRWTWNGDAEYPTFSPSILVQWDQAEPPVTLENLEEWKRNAWHQTKIHKVCHSFVIDGRIHFLSDCTHALAGQTIDLPDWNSES